ncbi:conserved Plasmodium protein, unknown function [Plasmodium vivax]|uniref:Uncharacterized protein n=2 Tax=Plasmodium vivax TaxID=5855 RepID=A0A0J9VUX9_PLAVI|nr:hypothetical protein PVMG_00277 [Plasmodium vivax Mauritania I]SCO74112.1 conserved Plasmodium protein, unknown function [Plasmodium vivax]
MSGGDVNKLISQDMQCEDTYKEDKIKIANRLIKNFSLLKELNLLSTIKSEHKGGKVTNGYTQDISYDGENIIYAKKYLLNFLQLKEEEKRKTKCNAKSSQQNFLSENDITLINDTLHENDLSLSTYTEKIIKCDEHNNFNIFNSEVMVKHVHVPTYDVVNLSTHSEKTAQMLTGLIKSYNDSLSLIKLQQSVINDFVFYTHSLMRSKQRLTRKNERLVKAHPGKNHSVEAHAVKDHPVKDPPADLTVPPCRQGSLPSIYKAQIDLYRRHINHLYEENDHLKEHLKQAQGGPND